MKDIRDQMEAYQELMQVYILRTNFTFIDIWIHFTIVQVKTALDMEIAVYKQLLETEEDRLGITPENGLSNSWYAW